MGVTEPLCETAAVNLAPEDGSAGGSVNLAAPASGGGSGGAGGQPGHANLGTSSCGPSSSAPPPAVAVAAGMAQKVMQRAAATSAAQGAKGLLQRGASEITLHVQANPYSVTVMSLVGGIVLTVVSLLNVLNVLNLFNPLNWILQLYQLAAGLLIVVIDGPSDKLPAIVHERFSQSAAFLLHSSTNRVLFYLFIACQQGTQQGLFNWIVGWYFAFVAIGFAAVTAAPPKPSAGEEEGQPLPVV